MDEQAQKKTASEMMLDYFRGFKVLRDTGIEYWGIQVINFLDCSAYFAILGIVSVFLSEEIGMNDENAGYAITIFTSATTLFLLVSGTITDWLGVKKSLFIALGCAFFVRLGIAFIGVADTVPYRGIIATVLLFLMAPFMAMVITVFQAANKRFTSKKSRSAGFNLWYLFMNVGAAAGGFSIDIVRKTLELSNAHIFTFGVIMSALSILAAIFMIRKEEQYVGEDEKSEKAAVEEKKDADPVKRKKPWQIFMEVVKVSTFWRFVVLISLLLGVRAVFTYMYLLMPKYWLRVIGPDAPIGIFQSINPILIVIGLIVFIPFANRYNIFKMLVYGAMVSAVSMFVLVVPYNFVGGDIASATTTLVILSLVVLSVGEVVWSPKLSEYTAAIAPAGQEGTYLGLSMLPWFLAKTLVSLFSGHMLTKWVPEGIAEKIVADEVGFWDSPGALWLILGILALAGPIICVLIKGWLTKGARWKDDEEEQEQAL